MKEELDIELPGEEDENVGDGIPKKKKEKKKKSKEERRAERRVIFWTFLIIIVVTVLFWLIPSIQKNGFKMPSFHVGTPGVNLPKTEWKGYVEYKL